MINRVHSSINNSNNINGNDRNETKCQPKKLSESSTIYAKSHYFDIASQYRISNDNPSIISAKYFNNQKLYLKYYILNETNTLIQNNQSMFKQFILLKCACQTIYAKLLFEMLDTFEHTL